MYSILHNYTFGNHPFHLMQAEYCCVGLINYSFSVQGGQTIEIADSLGLKDVKHMFRNLYLPSIFRARQHLEKQNQQERNEIL